MLRGPDITSPCRDPYTTLSYVTHDRSGLSYSLRIYPIAHGYFCFATFLALPIVTAVPL